MNPNEAQEHSILKLDRPWSNNNNTIWLASTIEVARNIEKFKFPAKLPSEHRKQIISLTSKEFQKSESFPKPLIYKAEDLSPTEKEFLNEHFLSTASYHQAHAGEAFIVEDSGEYLISINLGDHLNYHLIDTSGELEKAYTRLLKLESEVGKTLNYAFSQKFGFLTSDPTRCGTALTISLFLQLSALIHTETIDQLLEKEDEEGIKITGFQGSASEAIGDILTIQNNFTLGVNEEAILATIRGFSTKLLMEENNARNQIRKKKNPEIMDKVSRAYAILLHSYQIEAIEALNAISLLKLGLEFDWISGINTVELNRLFFNCRRAHLSRFMGSIAQQEEIPHKRAEYIHGVLKPVKLLI